MATRIDTSTDTSSAGERARPSPGEESRQFDTVMSDSWVSERVDTMDESLDRFLAVESSGRSEEYPALRDRFNELAEEWKRETVFVSSVTEKILHPCYQRIIGLGRKAIPAILADLRTSRAEWFWALESISGDDPISPEDRGDVDAMVNAWVEWGRTRGYIE